MYRRLRDLREDKDMNQTQIAEIIGISQTVYSRYERGFQSIPVDGIIIVTSPQELVSMIVEKAVKMAELMNVPILGLVENMSYFKCDECGKEHYIYGQSHLEELAAKHNIPCTARIPIDPSLAKVVDGGLVELFEGEWLDNMSDYIEQALAD